MNNKIDHLIQLKRNQQQTGIVMIMRYMEMCCLQGMGGPPM